ncbi:MAG: lytic transglycosylase domain-containing protein, partial [Acidobacteriota bacterium]
MTKSFEENAMKNRRFGREKRAVTLGLSALALSALSGLIGAPLQAQERPGSHQSGETQGATVRSANPTIQRIIENSNLHFQAGEESFKDGNFDRARREYDRAIDVILEAGLDIRTDSHLRHHYETIVENIFQRQMTLMVMAPSAADPEVEAGRGFGTQVFSPSPLDDLARIDLTNDETRGTTDEQARESVVAAHLDFGFKPNALIQSYINYYLGRGRATMEQGLRRSGRFMAMSRKIFREEGVPQDLVWLCQVESAWSPNARSWAAAVGLWQFIAPTGMRFGLQIDSWVDERSSFEKATRASARYLKFLADRYDGNWELAMAAYNTGEGRIDAAVAKSGYADFWEIYERGLIPRETRNYVPNILATIIIAKNPERFGFAVDPDPSLAYDFVKVNNLVDLKLVADATDSSPDLIEALNPELKRGVTPPSSEYLLR